MKITNRVGERNKLGKACSSQSGYIRSKSLAATTYSHIIANKVPQQTHVEASLESSNFAVSIEDMVVRLKFICVPVPDNGPTEVSSSSPLLKARLD